MAKIQELRRPAVFLATAFASGIFIEHSLGLPWLLAAGFFAFLCAFAIFGKRGELWVLVLVFVSLGMLNLGIREAPAEKRALPEGVPALLKGYAVSVEERDEDYYRLVLKVGPNKVLVNASGELPEGLVNAGDIVGRPLELEGTPTLAASRRNPGCFDYRLYLSTRGISRVMSVKSEALRLSDGKVRGFSNAIWRMRVRFEHRVTDFLGEDLGGLVNGMILGDKTGLSEDIGEMFRKNGTAHILAVSGIHVGILYALVAKLFAARRSAVASSLAALVLLCYGAFTAFSPSVLRAILMILLHILSVLIFRRYDMLSAAMCCAFVILVFQPLMLYNTGFQLSFMAIFCMAVVLPLLAYKLGEGPVAKVFAPALAIQLAMPPLTAYVFNYFSFFTMLLNLPVIFLAGFAVPFGIALLPLAQFGGDVANFLFGGFATAEGWLCEVMIKLNKLAYMGGKGFAYVVSPSVFLLALYYGLLFFLTSEAFAVLWSRRKKASILRTFAGLLVLAVFVQALAFDPCAKADITFVDVGQGDCVHIRTPSGKNVLIDSGGRYNYDVGEKILLPYLLRNGARKIDFCLITHRHMDHYKGLTSLAKELEIEEVCFYEANRVEEELILEELGCGPERIKYAVAGDVFDFGDGVKIEILAPGGGLSDEEARSVLAASNDNEICLVARVAYENASLLITGDISAGAEEQLAGGGLTACDLLKVAHHGSKYASSAAFLAEAGPRVAVIQVGKNNYGHPAAEALARLSACGACVYRNDLSGAVCITIKKGSFRVRVCVQ